ncbi:MAG: hypothetical protein R3F37_03430 [Candidatus Competibacteraceae bacterium]
MAKLALTRKLDYDRIADSLKPSWVTAKNTSARLREQLKNMEMNLLEISRKRSALVVSAAGCQGATVTEQHPSQLQRRADTANQVYHMEERIAAAEAEAQAITEVIDEQESLEKEFAAQEKDLILEEELAVRNKRPCPPPPQATGKTVSPYRVTNNLPRITSWITFPTQFTLLAIFRQSVFRRFGQCIGARYFLHAGQWRVRWVVYGAMGTLFVVGSTFTFAKTVRDEFEAKKLINRIQDAKTERMLKDHDTDPDGL